MFHIRVLSLATTAGLVGCLCGAFTDTCRKSFLKVNAQPHPQDAEAILWGANNAGAHHPHGAVGGAHHPHGAVGEPHHPHGPVGGAHHPQGAVGGAHQPQGAVGGAHEPQGAVGGAQGGQAPLHWLPFEMGGPVFPHPEVPIRHVLEYKDFLLCYDNQTRTPSWTMEIVTKENVGELYVTERPNRTECRIAREFQTAAGDYASNPAIASSFKQLLLASDEFHDDRVDPHVLSNVAAFIKDETASNLMKDFNNYIRFLTRHHCNIYVLSGALYIPQRKADGKWMMDYQLFSRKQIGVPTHFFKAILAQNADGRTFRLECFKFPNSAACYRCDTKLADLHCTRKDLQKEAGFLIFEDIGDVKVTEKCLHPDFIRQTLDPARHRPCPAPQPCPMEHH